MKYTVDRYLFSADLEAVPVKDADVLALWNRAERALGDSRESGISLDGRLLCACAAALFVALAIARAAGYRFPMRDDQQQIVFEVARSLVGRGELADAFTGMSHFLSLRYAIENEPYDTANAHDVSAAILAATLVINLGAKHLRAARPDAAKRIHLVKA